MNQDDEHLRLLSIFHYVVGGLAALFSCLALIYVALGIFLAVAPHKLDAHGVPPPSFLGWIFAFVGSVIFLMGEALAGCILAAGRSLAKRRNYTFALVVAALECLFTPFGTVLGVFTILVLMRPSVKLAFNAIPAPPTMPPAR